MPMTYVFVKYTIQYGMYVITTTLFSVHTIFQNAIRKKTQTNKMFISLRLLHKATSLEIRFIYKFVEFILRHFKWHTEFIKCRSVLLVIVTYKMSADNTTILFSFFYRAVNRRNNSFCFYVHI